MGNIDKAQARKRRHLRVRKNISGTSLRPRLAVFRSNKHIYAQLIDDIDGVTIASVSSEMLKKKEATGNMGAAGEVGKLIAKKANEKKIEKVVFDRGGYLYHGRVKALAEAARENGLLF